MGAHGRSWGSVLLAVLGAASLAACGAAADRPQITHVQPSLAAPGSLVLVSGRGFERADIVWLNGQPAWPVTWVNAQLLTAVVPAGLAAGAYPLEVRSLDGERVAVSLNVGDPSTAPSLAPPVAEAAPGTTPAPAPAPTSAAEAARPVLPPTPTTARPQAPAPAAAPVGASEAQRKADERQREAEKKLEEQLREAQKKAEERQREAEKQRQEDEKKRQEQQPRR